MTNLDSILKSRDITFPTKVCLVKAPDDRQSRLHLGHLWLASGNPGACTDSSQSPSTPPPPASQAIAHAHVRAHAQRDEPKRGMYLVHLYCGWIYAWESDC